MGLTSETKKGRQSLNGGSEVRDNREFGVLAARWPTLVVSRQAVGTECISRGIWCGSPSPWPHRRLSVAAVTVGVTFLEVSLTNGQLKDLLPVVGLIVLGNDAHQCRCLQWDATRGCVADWNSLRPPATAVQQSLAVSVLSLSLSYL